MSRVPKGHRPPEQLRFIIESDESVEMEIVAYKSLYCLTSARLYDRLQLQAEYTRKDLIHATRR